LSVNPESIIIEEGKTESIQITILPSNASSRNLIWKSGDSKIAMVDAVGNITALLPGETTITVSTPDGTITATCMVTVKAAIVNVNKIELSVSNLSIELGSTENISATVFPENASNKTIGWSTSDANVATVDNFGKILAIGIGSCSIIATSADGITTATCNVEVVTKTSIDKISNKTLKLYPNPLKSGKLTIDHTNNGMVDISIIDITGVVRLTHKANSQTITIDCISLSKGMYFVKINQQVSKLIIE